MLFKLIVLISNEVYKDCFFLNMVLILSVMKISVPEITKTSEAEQTELPSSSL